ncbi:MAG TPA: ABC transporter ATP-binding protein [Tepidisphaeraceae bacterium]|nr:ABC transporter ATP-binding protein [Tepidisphaeraceae bacterium]
MPVWLEELKKEYVSPDGQAVPVIDVPFFRLEDGEQVALVGGSGTGKTTLLHLIAGILVPDRGRICFGREPEPAAPIPAVAAGDGPVLAYRSPAPGTPGIIDITSLSEAQRDQFRGRYIGYIFQTHHLLPGFTAQENVLLGMSFTGRRTDPQWAKYLLREVGLAERLNYKPGKLSVGQQQRVAVARALANRPKLVLADEPTGALDPKTAQQVLDLIRRLCKEVGASLLLVSHDPKIVEQLPRAVALSELNRASTATNAAVAV